MDRSLAFRRIFSWSAFHRGRPLYVIVLVAACLGPMGCNPLADSYQKAQTAKVRLESTVNMHNLLIAMFEYSSIHGRWPDRLDELKDYVGGETVLNQLMKNPLTGDDPGYEYVKPPENLNASNISSQIVLYQLRDGQRDLSLSVGYGDGSIRPMETPSQ